MFGLFRDNLSVVSYSLVVRVKSSNNSPFLSGEDFKVHPFVLMSADVEHIKYFLVTGCAGVVSHIILRLNLKSEYI